MLRQLILPCAAIPLLAGCVATTMPLDGTQFRSENWSLAAESGFVVSPPVAIPGVVDPVEAAALFTNEFYSALLISLPGTRLTSPSQTLDMLNATGSDAHARFRALRRKLYRNEDLGSEELASISRDVQHRFVLVGWFDERVSQETQGGGYSIVHQEQGDVELFTYEQVNGRATAVVLDLWVNEILWRGMVDYKTNRVDDDGGGLREELDLTRIGAAIRLADCLGQL